MHRRLLPAVLLVACAAAACGPSQPGAAAHPTRTVAAPAAAAAATGGSAPPATRTLVLHTADGERSALVHHPADVAAGSPLVVVLHPAGASAGDTQARFGWDAVAERDGLVVAYPEGSLDGFQDTWNGGRCCPPASDLGTDDVGFLDALVRTLRRTDGVGRQVYAVGFSNGAIMAYAWACARPGTLAGVGVVAGALMTGCGAPGALTVVAVHGDADDRIPLGGGTTPTGAVLPALEQSLSAFHPAPRCGSPADVTATPVARVTVYRCADGTRVVQDVVTGLGHAWPGAGAAAGSTPGPLDATGFLWAQLRPGA